MIHVALWKQGAFTSPESPGLFRQTTLALGQRDHGTVIEGAGSRTYKWLLGAADAGSEKCDWEQVTK